MSIIRDDFSINNQVTFARYFKDKILIGYSNGDILIYDLNGKTFIGKF